eukprot:TRINITY_DN8284_c0_g4_i1.p1 TRINITY_DN8284_c0_g4~~TRINITY_DN8284_c0_g4_i1.p1  ORF type:complete len:223 (-),score=41.89 TRINITY_DN8284_c0_g4_i1:80-748(-)
MSFYLPKEQTSWDIMMQDTFIDDCPFLSDSESCDDFAEKNVELHTQEFANHKDLLAVEQAAASPFTPVTLRDVPRKISNVSIGTDNSRQLLTQEPASLEELRADVPETASTFTTVMLRNVPCKINKASVEVELVKLGFANKYDYIYFPARRNKSTIGYGFINFITSHDALAFMDIFDGYAFPGTSSTKRCSVSRADVQGREANLDQWGNQSRNTEAKMQRWQ